MVIAVPVGLGLALGILEFVARLTIEHDESVNLDKLLPPPELIEMVNAEMDEWQYQLAIHYSATLPRELIDDIRQRMIHVGRVMGEQKSIKRDEPCE